MPQQRAALLRRIAEAARAGVDYIQLREKDLDPADLELLAREALHVIRTNPRAYQTADQYTRRCRTGGRRRWRTPSGRFATSFRRSAAEWLNSNRARTDYRRLRPHASAICNRQRRRRELRRAGSDLRKGRNRRNGIGLEALREACAASHIPVLRVGRSQCSANARACLEAGAAGIAGIRLFQQGDVTETVR